VIAWLVNTEITSPEPGQEVYWLLGLLATACGLLFWQLISAKDGRAGDWKGIAEKATTNLEAALASLRAINEAVERTSRDQSAQLERNAARIAETAQEARAIRESLGACDRRLERIEAQHRPRPPDS